MTLLDQFDLANGDADFLKRVQMAIVRAARAIQAEDPQALITPPGVKDTDPKQALYLKRSALAYKVLNSPEGWARLFAQVIASTDGIASKVDDGKFIVEDAAIEAEVLICWNAFSLGA